MDTTTKEKMVKEEEQETPEQEKAETTEHQKKEDEAGIEGVVISEKFQQEVHKLIGEYAESKDCLEFMREQVNDALDEIRRKEDDERMAKRAKLMKGKGVPDHFDGAEMPSVAYQFQ